MQSQLTNISHIKEPRTDSLWERHGAIGMVGLLSLPLVMGIAMWEIGSGQSDVHSGNSMTTCCVVNANMDSGEPGSQYCMTKHGSSYPQIVY